MGFSKAHILATVDRQKDLLQKLAQTDYANSALKQTNEYIKDLEGQILKLERRLKQLESKTSQEQKDHKKYHESTVRRMAYHVSGHKEKFESKAAKEEREYFDAVQEEKRAKDTLVMAKKDLHAAEEEKRAQEKVVGEHAQAQAELDSLYNSIFAGHTPGLPEEDAREGSVRKARIVFRDAQAKVDVEMQVVRILTDAQAALKECLQHLSKALDASDMDVLGIGGGLGDMMERNSLSKAQSAGAQTEMLVKQAQRTSPNVDDIGPMHIASGNIMSDIFFDNVFSDYKFHQKLEQTDTELRFAAANLSAQLSSAKQRAKDLAVEARKNLEQLDDARKNLQSVRTAAFEKMAEA